MVAKIRRWKEKSAPLTVSNIQGTVAEGRGGGRLESQAEMKQLEKEQPSSDSVERKTVSVVFVEQSS